MQSEPPIRPKLTTRALRRWVPPLVRHIPDLVSAFLLLGRIPPKTREAAMLGVTSVNRCAACEAVHGRWAKEMGLRLDALSPDEAVAYAFGQRLAVSGPHEARPPRSPSMTPPSIRSWRRSSCARSAMSARAFARPEGC